MVFSGQVFDAFNPRLTDRNSKVNLRALEAFSNMVPLLGSLLAPLSANIIKAIMPNLASKNSSILAAATTVFDLISQCVGESFHCLVNASMCYNEDGAVLIFPSLSVSDPACLIQPIATHSQHGNARIQPIMINKLAGMLNALNHLHHDLMCVHCNTRLFTAELAEVIYSYNPRLVVRQILPVVWHFLAGKPPGSNEVKEAIVALCQSLYSLMEQSFLDSASSLPPQSQQRLNRILHSSNFS